MLFVLVVKQASCNSHAAAGAYSELNGCILTMKVMSLLQQRTTGELKSLVKASVDNRLFKYPEHSNNLHMNPVGRINQELASTGARIMPPLMLLSSSAH